MKRALNFYKILFAYLFFLYIFSSCNSSSKSNHQKAERDNSPSIKKLEQPPTTVVISITNYDATSQTLDLRINGNPNYNAKHVHTSANAKIRWNTTAKGNEIDIVKIAPDPDYDNYNYFFSNGPKEYPSNSGLWEATINPSLNEYEFYVEKYYIKWKMKNTTAPIYNYDPLMQVNPIKIAPLGDSTKQ